MPLQPDIAERDIGRDNRTFVTEKKDYRVSGRTTYSIAPAERKVNAFAKKSRTENRPGTEAEPE
jgi:hypothetical protein